MVRKVKINRRDTDLCPFAAALEECEKIAQSMEARSSEFAHLAAEFAPMMEEQVALLQNSPVAKAGAEIFQMLMEQSVALQKDIRFSELARMSV